MILNKKIILATFFIFLTFGAKVVTDAQNTPSTGNAQSISISSNNNAGGGKTSNLTNHDNSIQCRTKCPQLGQICVKSPGNVITCETICGDGFIAGNQKCDDGNSINGDGCTNCAIDQGWSCTGQPSNCISSNLCGNGKWDSGEQCDYSFMTNCNTDCKISQQLSQECSAYNQQITPDSPSTQYNSAVDQTFICGDQGYGFGCVNCIYIPKGYECGFLDNSKPSSYFCAIKCPASSSQPYIDNEYLLKNIATLLVLAIDKYFPNMNNVGTDVLNTQQFIDLLKINNMYEQIAYNGYDPLAIVQNFSNTYVMFIMFVFRSITNVITIQSNGFNTIVMYYPDNQGSFFKYGCSIYKQRLISY